MKFHFACLKVRLLLRQVSGVGLKTIERLKLACGLSLLWEMDLGAIRELQVLSNAQLEMFSKLKQAKVAEQEMDEAHRHGVNLLIPEDAAYPELLQQILDPPSVLYVRGHLKSHARRLGLVGTRLASVEGLQNTRLFASHAAMHGIEVVSGLARGVDRAAHEAALKHGRTLAVLGTGVLNVYPKEHRHLYHQIREAGAILSEFGLNEPPVASHFPYRNRIISGLSQGIVVMEAPKRSGALITASQALQQGRDVFTLPGSIRSAAYQGNNSLLQDGAVCVTHPRDVLEYLGWKRIEMPVATRFNDPVLQSLERGAKNLEAIQQASGLGPVEVLSRLSELELCGKVLKYPGQRYALEQTH